MTREQSKLLLAAARALIAKWANGPGPDLAASLAYIGNAVEELEAVAVTIDD